MIKLPTFSLLEKNSFGGTCDGCGREIKHVYKLRNNETNSVGEFGSGCAQNFMEGKTITEVAKEGEAYKRALIEEDVRLEGAHRMQEFKELHPEMLQYISDNQDFSFMVSMKDAIEKYGVLTQGQYDVVYGMMLEPCEFETSDKVKDLVLDIFRVKVDHNDWGTNFTLLGETANGKLVRVYFSSMSQKNEDIFINKEILRVTGHGEYEFRASTEFPRRITVNGTYDGYKLKRVKVA